jgi:hypothetical protein
MHALQVWNGGVILISHDERFITKVASEVGSLIVIALDLRSWFLIVMGLWGRHSEEVLRGCEGL